MEPASPSGGTPSVYRFAREGGRASFTQEVPSFVSGGQNGAARRFLSAGWLRERVPRVPGALPSGARAFRAS